MPALLDEQRQRDMRSGSSQCLTSRETLELGVEAREYTYVNEDEIVETQVQGRYFEDESAL